MRLARGFSSASCSDSLPFKPEPKDQTTSTRPNRLVSELRNETLPPINVPLKPAVVPGTVPDLILRLCGQRSTPEMLAIMTDAADNDEQRLQHCLDTFFRQGKRWTTLELLTGAAQYDLRPRGYFDGYWSRPFHCRGAIA